jgi:transcriptional regulator with XRE-family HTH domain
MNIGEKIKSLRLQNNLTQEELANRTELSKGFISQLERDLTSPSIATLVDVLTCLGTDLHEFFKNPDKEQVVFKEGDYFLHEQTDHKHQLKWLIPNAQKNMMEPIYVTLESEGSTIPDLPHEGEEFGYVIKGSILLHLGSDVYKVKSGESFYFSSDVKHLISNPFRQCAQFIWVSTPPNF